MANPAADYPAALHTNTDVSGFSSSKLGSTSPTHTALEGKQEEEILAAQTKIGTGASTPTANKVLRGTGVGTSAWGGVVVADLDTGVLDTDLTSVSGSDDTLPSAKATKTYADTKVGLTDTQTLTNKTLTSPKVNEILDTNGNEAVKFTATGSAVNEITVANAATGFAPTISATGGDTDITLWVRGKGAGSIVMADGTSQKAIEAGTSGTAVNYYMVTGTATGVAPLIEAKGTDTNIDVNLKPKGTGVVKQNGTALKTDSMATNKLLGRGTAGTGAIEEITLGTNLSLSGTTLNATGGGSVTVEDESLIIGMRFFGF